VIEYLYYLSIIMESYRMYGQDKALKGNMVASLRLKILNIEESFKDAHRCPHFFQISEAYNLAAYLLDFIL